MFFLIFFKCKTKKKNEFHEKCNKKNIFNRLGVLMNYLSRIYIVCYRCMPKKQNKKITVSFPGKTLLKLKQMPKKIKQFPSRTCCKHNRPLPYCYWPVIAVLQQCADGMAILQTLIRPFLGEQADLSLHCSFR